MRPVPALTRNGSPTNRAKCFEGDPRCDADPVPGDDTCTFAVRVCVNNSDARLPACDPSGVRSIQVKQPRWTSSDPADVANLATLEAQAGNGLGGFGLAVYRGRTEVTSGSTNATPNLCSDPLSLAVPLRRRATGIRVMGRRSIVVRVMGANTLADTDKLSLSCYPSTCGNGMIEFDHESCDDGNRLNGDGCNSGCQLE